MAKPMGDSDLAVILEKAVSQSEHFTDGKLAKERLEVEKYLRGELPKPLHAGDSKYVSRDVFDAVDSMRSTVLESFLAHQRIVYFQPEKGETVDDAKQATDYCRHVVFKENDGEQILYDVLTDGLTKRFSVVKVRYEELTDEEEFEFDALTGDELTAAVSEHENYEFTEADLSPEGLYGGSFRVLHKTKRIALDTIQPEDLLVASRTTSLADAKYVIHRVTKSRSDLLKAGFKKSKVEALSFSNGVDIDKDYVKQARFDPIGDIISSNDTFHTAVEEVVLHECYIRLDMEGKGTDDLWKVTYCQGHILDKEKISRMPFAIFVPLPVPHTFFGENFAASVIPIQNARTVLIRQIINHTMITNNPRTMVLNGTVQNPLELMENRVGGIVNVRRMDGLMPMPQAPLNPFVFNLIQMIDEDKEEVTGVSKLSQGLNKDAISTQNAQGMVEQLISQSQQRQKIVARRFGKFLKDLYGLIYHIARDYVDEAEIADATGGYIPINPSEWVERSAASIELTLGYGELQREADKWTQVDQYFSQDPVLQRGYDYAKRYEVVRRGLQGRGVEDIEAILTHPDELPPPEPSPAEQLQMEQLKSQIEYQKAQAQAMISKAESDKIKAQADLIRAQADAQFKAQQAQIDAGRLKLDTFVSSEEIRMAETVNDENKNAMFNPDT